MLLSTLTPLAFLGFPGGAEWFIVLGIFILLFGGAKLPGLMRNLGRSVNEFKAGIKESPAEANIDEKPEEETE
ncbi:MAG: twin-arginine translocase TatA/TatE family subunit [Planctomycetota bacterium]